MGFGGLLADAAEVASAGFGASKRKVGTQGDDEIRGTGGSDVIFADPLPYDDQGGDDRVWGRAGDDYIRAFGGDNFVDGGPGDDELITADGDDIIYGGPGDDEIQAGRGADLVYGGPGDDELRGGEGNDVLYGGEGQDRVIGSSGDDLIHGGPGADWLEGREGIDRFVWSSPEEGRDLLLDFELGIDGLVLDGFLTGWRGDLATLGLSVRFVPTGNGGSLLQVDADGNGPAPWRDLAEIAGQARLNAGALLTVGDLAIGAMPAAGAFSSLAYIASYDDLIAAFGDDRLAGKRHFLVQGYEEGRGIGFEGEQYIASHADLIAAFGDDPARGTEHFVRTGWGEGRARDAFDEVQYVANHADLQAAFGTDYAAATRHFIAYGFAEGRDDRAPDTADFIV